MALDVEYQEVTPEGNAKDFDRNSGSILERLLFNNRIVFLLICAVVTIFLGIKALDVRVSADYDQMIPTHHPFIVNYLKHYDALQSQANAIRIAVTATSGTIIDPHYLHILQQINDKTYLLPGVDRPYMTSLWTSNMRWFAVTAQGSESGPVIANSYDGSQTQRETVRQNILRTGQVGSLVSSNFKSSMIYVPLLKEDGLTGKPNYGDLARRLNAIRTEYASQGVSVRIIGFAMIVGDMINGINRVLLFFAASVLISAAFLFWYTRCVRSTALVLLASLTAVLWQMGLLSIFGFGLTPYSVLVPFLIFAIGISHAAQKMNGVLQDIGRGVHPLIAARYTFRRLFVAGFAALICDMASFAVLLTIRIAAIQQLATIASIGVGLLIITNLMMLPIMLSFTGVSKAAAARSLENTPAASMPRANHMLWNTLDLFTRRKYAIGTLLLMALIGCVGLYYGRNVQVGDLQPGAPELRQNSQYNRDYNFIVQNFVAGSDTFIVMVDTPVEGCMNLDAIDAMDRLQWQLRQLPAVKSARSAASFADSAAVLLTEDSPKWFGLEPNRLLLSEMGEIIPADLANAQCSFDPIYLYLADHKAKSLNAVIDSATAFIDDPANQAWDFKMSLAGGNAGIEAATNSVIAQANRNMLLLVYAVVTMFCLITLRSWRAMVCAVLPLIITSILAQALMVWLGIGVKVATLPVIAFGVGIGVDYALYVLSIMLRHLRAGNTLSEAYYRTLLFTGRVVILTGITLATCVATWAFAPIKFQADMGILLSFMFIWNMVGAMVLLPALAYFLLPKRLFE